MPVLKFHHGFIVVVKQIVNVLKFVTNIVSLSASYFKRRGLRTFVLYPLQFHVCFYHLNVHNVHNVENLLGPVIQIELNGLYHRVWYQIHVPGWEHGTDMQNGNSWNKMAAVPHLLGLQLPVLCMYANIKPKMQKEKYQCKNTKNYTLLESEAMGQHGFPSDLEIVIIR